MNSAIQHCSATQAGTSRTMPCEGDAQLVRRRRFRLGRLLPDMGIELERLFDDLSDSDSALVCIDADGVVLFVHIGSALVDDLLVAGLAEGMNWYSHRHRLLDKVYCHMEPLSAADGSKLASLAVLTRSNAAAPYSAALARMAARLIGYRAASARSVGIAVPSIQTIDGPELTAHRARLGAAERISTGDPMMARNLEMAQRLTTRNIPILLIGDTGTGKEVFARALHDLSHRYAGRFIAVNCASVPETLIESELFGYRHGAFTGSAREGYRGKIMQADGGTLFLDEIGDMPLPLQARLLRVLETREVTPLGGESAVNVDIQVVSATHRDLENNVRDGRFREDLYFRLCGMRIDLPRLRERSDRRELLMQVLDEESEGCAVFDAVALDALDGYAWPGNLRELRNVIRVALALSETEVIRPEHLPLTLGNVMTYPVVESGDERTRLLASIERQRWNLSAVARTLCVSRNTLYRRMRRLGIAMPSGGRI